MLKLHVFLNGGSTCVTQATNRGLMNSKNRKKSDPYLSKTVADGED